MCASYRDPFGNLSLHHNLFSACRDRHPTPGSTQVPPRYEVDFRNKVIYNCSAGGTANFADHFINCVNNLFRSGSMSEPARFPIAMKGSLARPRPKPRERKRVRATRGFDPRQLRRARFQTLAETAVQILVSGTLVDWKADSAPDLNGNMPRTQSATEAAELVLAQAGASLHREAVNRRVIDDVRIRRGKLIDSHD